ncbi:MAG: hypothetical protein QOF49_326 [Chloroflexota bacterium]|jgi:signal transduction histidine kinase|nr:hypothetical protein [Chloroflexota bacterium]
MSDDAPTSAGPTLLAPPVNASRSSFDRPRVNAGADERRLLAIAVATTTALTILAAAVVVGSGASTVADVVPVLVAAAGICAALLARGAAPSLAWLATVAAALAAGSVPIAAAQGLDPQLLGVGPWEIAAVRSSIAAVVALGVTSAYATRPRRRLDPVAIPIALGSLGWLIVACVVTLTAVAAGQRQDPAFTWVDVATAPIGLFHRLVAIVAVLGIAGDVRAAAQRAAARDGRDGDDSASSRAQHGVALAADTLRELWPGQAELHETTRTAERSRLAGDLHAVVLPSLRRAIAEAEAGGDADVLAQHLRTVDLELERLMADRWPVVLEAFGIVAALEDLAEQVEAAGGLKVEIDVERAAGRPPIAIERTAWRVAQLAVDNVVRHAAATTIAIRVGVGAGRVTLSIADDGRGFDPSRPGSVRAGGRGLADASRRAAAVGGTIRFECPPGRGATIVFTWSADRLNR